MHFQCSCCRGRVWRMTCVGPCSRRLPSSAVEPTHCGQAWPRLCPSPLHCKTFMSVEFIPPGLMQMKDEVCMNIAWTKVTVWNTLWLDRSKKRERAMSVQFPVDVASVWCTLNILAFPEKRKKWVEKREGGNGGSREEEDREERAPRTVLLSPSATWLSEALWDAGWGHRAAMTCLHIENVKS